MVRGRNVSQRPSRHERWWGGAGRLFSASAFSSPTTAQGFRFSGNVRGMRYWAFLEVTPIPHIQSTEGEMQAGHPAVVNRNTCWCRDHYFGPKVWPLLFSCPPAVYAQVLTLMLESVGLWRIGCVRFHCTSLRTEMVHVCLWQVSLQNNGACVVLNGLS